MAEPTEAVEELLDAARHGDYEDASAALDSGTPVNGTDELGRTGETDHVSAGCHCAAIYLYSAAVRCGFSAGLHMACANGHAGIVHLLISAGAVRLLPSAAEIGEEYAC
jgi:hypothetical protein